MNSEKDDERIKELLEQMSRFDKWLLIVRLYWLLCRSKIRTLPQRWATWQMRVKP